MWDASARLAYLLEIEPNLQTALTDLDGPKEIADRMAMLSAPLEDVFERRAGELLRPGATSLADIDRSKVTTFVDEAEDQHVRTGRRLHT